MAAGFVATVVVMEVVVAAALFRAAEVLLCHRTPTRRWFPDVWDLPGGHVEVAESPRAALARELREKLTVCVAAADLSTRPHRHLVGTDLRMSVWRIDSWVGEPVNAATYEHDEIRWFGLTDASTLQLAHPPYPALLQDLAALQDSC